MSDDGLAYVKEITETPNWSEPRLKMGEGLAEVPDNILELVIESAEECPGECIFIEP
jgi:ferredoxin